MKKIKKINELIATKVMGWCRKTNREASGYSADFVFEEPDEWWDELNNSWYDAADKTDQNPVDQVEDGLYREDGFGFSPSTRIEAAWEVVTRMFTVQPVGHVGPAGLHELRSCDHGATWEIIFCTDFGYTPSVKANTAPLAICIAALRAVGTPDDLITAALKSDGLGGE